MLHRKLMDFTALFGLKRFTRTKDKKGKTLYAVYHNENYPQTFPYNARSGKGYIDKDWPQGLTGAKTPAAVCRMEL